MERSEFQVSVVGYNADKFRDDYERYITNESEWYGNVIFTLYAPKSVYEEIEGLKEESIEIIDEEPASDNLDESPLTDGEISALISAAHVRLNGIRGYYTSEEEELESALKKLQAMKS